MEQVAKQTVLIVDDVADNLTVLGEVLIDEYRVRVANSGRKALEIARSEAPPDLILLDIMMPDMDGYEVCRQLKMDDRTRRIPVIFVTALDEEEDESRGLLLGAVDYLTKPISAPIVRARAATHLRLYDQERHLSELVEQRTAQLAQSRLDILWRLGRAAELRDEDTGNHIVRVGLYSSLLAEELGLSRDHVERILLASPLHDIGKIGIPDAILLKPGRLDDAEWELMRQHCTMGEVILREPSAGMQAYLERTSQEPAADDQNPLVETAAVIAATHHEKWNGKGYPNGLSKQEIPIEGRIVALADVYDALSSHRPYKAAFPELKVLSILEEEAGEHFDPSVYAVFERLIPQFREIRHRFD
ncbi:MAG: response regulator [Armatimonadetes bacterium]|nr:response regulator [Armatimonadota bacterium]